MTSFTKQLRMGLRTAARENIEPAPEMGPDEIQATLAEPVAAEIEQEVVAPAADIEQGNAALMEADTDANTLENTAAIVEGSIGDGTTDVDVATSELANITVERIASKYGMARAMKVSKESFGTAENRLAMARGISKEAMEQAGELRKRVSEGVAKIIEWFKNLIKSIFDKRTKLEKRFQAIQAAAKAKSAEGLESAPEGKTIRLSGHGYVKGNTVDNVMTLVADGSLKKFIDGIKTVAEFSKDSTASNNGQTTGEAHDFNPDLFGGLTLKASLDNGKLVVTKEQTNQPEQKDIAPLPVGWVTNASRQALDALNHLKAVEAEFNKIVAEMGNGAQKLKALATGKEDGESAPRANILARYQGVSKLGSSISSTALVVLAAVATACEQSLPTYEKAAA